MTCIFIADLGLIRIRCSLSDGGVNHLVSAKLIFLITLCFAHCLLQPCS